MRDPLTEVNVTDVHDSELVEDVMKLWDWYRDTDNLEIRWIEL